MARFPGAKWSPLPENSTQGKIVPTQLIYHSSVDAPGPTDLGKYFGRADVVVESHFFVHLDGACDQFMDSEIMADANLKANVRAISVETEDDGNSELPWTPAQLSTMKSIALWATAVHGIPLVACPAWDAPGVGFHSMWGFKDNRTLTGPINNPWSPSLGKTCPGRVRVAQFWGEFLPSLNQEDTQMDDATARSFVTKIYRAILGREPDATGLDYWVAKLVGGATKEEFFWAFLEGASSEMGSNRATLTALITHVNDLEARVRTMETKPAQVSVDVDAVIAAVAKKLGG